MIPRAAENRMLLVAGITLALIGSLIIRQYLPVQYLLDDAHLRDAMGGGGILTDAESFSLIAEGYRMMGLDAAPPLAGLLGMLIFSTAVLLAISWQDLSRITVPTLLLIGVVFVPGLVYLGQFSKEIVTALLALLVLALPAGNTAGRRLLAEIAIVAAALAYGVLLRPYWLIIAALYVVVRLTLPRTRHPLALLAIPAVAFAILQPLFLEVLGSGLQGQREWSNAERPAGTEVATLIPSIAPDATGVVGVLAALAMVGLMLVPLGLLLSGSAFHMAAGVLITLLWLSVLVPVLRGAYLAPRGEHRSGAATSRQVRATRAAALLLSVVMVQALFEPDYGSVLKHLAPLLPLLVLIRVQQDLRPRGRRSA
ncbi:MAG: hypothetical protein Q4G40_08540 [Brachybacterium sp.]|nr:hypothetical protein [Brachybacterium sp.]